MLAISIAFTANRYHATQWGRHVNEGVPEWPPSPWRILRAIVATWRRTLPGLSTAQVVPILEALASELPHFHLPAASTGHTRHFMPLFKAGSSTLVIDSFVSIRANEPVFALWPNVELDSAQGAVLSTILRNMPYLGRAESWIEASLASKHPEINSYPLETGSLPQGDWEISRTLTPRTPIKLEDLEVETSVLRRGGRIDPEGAQWWPYIRKADCFTAYRSQRRRRPAHGAGATVLRFAIAGRPLPIVSDTLRWGELARKSAMAKYGRQNGGGRSKTLSGKDASSKPLRGHRHAFYVPTDEDGDGHIDHLTIWTPGGLAPEEFKAIVSVNALDPGGQRKPVQLVYQAHGREEDFEGVSPLFSKSRRWRSLTPYVLTRHVKVRGPKHQRRIVDGPVEQVRREITLRWPDGPGLDKVDCLNPRDPIKPIRGGRSVGFRTFDFYKYRSSGPKGGGAYNVEIEFEEELEGPVLLGFACHYGLGIFVPAE